MKLGNPIIDHAQALTESVLPTVQQGFAQVYAALLGLGLAPQLNYTYLHQLLKDIEAPYNNWEKSVKILEEIADIEPTVLGKYKENLQRIYDFGQDVRRLGGIDIASLESSPNAQARLNELYTTYREGFLQLVPPMQQAYTDIIGAATIKDQRPMIEKYAPFIEMLPPENKLIFIQNIEDNSRAGKNPVVVELHYLSQMPQNAYRAIYPLPNQAPGGNQNNEDNRGVGDDGNNGNNNSQNQQNQDEDQDMIRQLQAQLEQMRQERDHAIGQRDDARGQVAQQEHVITEQNTRLTEFSNSMSQLAQLQQQLTQEREQAIRNIDEANQERDTANQRADQMTIERDTANQERDTANQRADQMTIERDNALEQRDTALEQVADRDRIIEEQGNRITELTDTVNDRDTQIDNLNTTIQNLQEGHADQSPQISDLTHRLEVVTIQKEAAEHTVIDRDREIAALRSTENDLRQNIDDLRQSRNDLRERNDELKAQKAEVKQAKDILEARVEDLNHQKSENKLFIHQVKVYVDEYVDLMGACQNCNGYIHHDISWPSE